MFVSPHFGLRLVLYPEDRGVREPPPAPHLLEWSSCGEDASLHPCLARPSCVGGKLAGSPHLWAPGRPWTRGSGGGAGGACGWGATPPAPTRSESPVSCFLLGPAAASPGPCSLRTLGDLTDQQDTGGPTDLQTGTPSPTTLTQRQASPQRSLRLAVTSWEGPGQGHALRAGAARPASGRWQFGRLL